MTALNSVSISEGTAGSITVVIPKMGNHVIAFTSALLSPYPALTLTSLLPPLSPSLSRYTYIYIYHRLFRSKLLLLLLHATFLSIWTFPPPPLSLLLPPPVPFVPLLHSCHVWQDWHTLEMAQREIFSPVKKWLMELMRNMVEKHITLCSLPRMAAEKSL